MQPQDGSQPPNYLQQYNTSDYSQVPVQWPPQSQWNCPNTLSASSNNPGPNAPLQPASRSSLSRSAPPGLAPSGSARPVSVPPVPVQAPRPYQGQTTYLSFYPPPQVTYQPPFVSFPPPFSYANQPSFLPPPPPPFMMQPMNVLPPPQEQRALPPPQTQCALPPPQEQQGTHPSLQERRPERDRKSSDEESNPIPEQHLSRSFRQQSVGLGIQDFSQTQLVPFRPAYVPPIDSNREVTQLKADVDCLIDKVNASRSEARELRNRNSSLQQTIQARENEIRGLQEQIKDLQETIQAREAEIRGLEEQVTDFNNARSDAVSTVQRVPSSRGRTRSKHRRGTSSKPHKAAQSTLHADSPVFTPQSSAMSRSTSQLSSSVFPATQYRPEAAVIFDASYLQGSNTVSVASQIGSSAMASSASQDAAAVTALATQTVSQPTSSLNSPTFYQSKFHTSWLRDGAPSYQHQQVESVDMSRSTSRLNVSPWTVVEAPRFESDDPSNAQQGR